MVQLQNWIAENATSWIAMVMWPCSSWLVHTQKFWRFGFSPLCCHWTIRLTAIVANPAAKVSQEVNGKCPAGNVAVQLSTPYTDPERQNIHHHGWTDRSANCRYINQWIHSFIQCTLARIPMCIYDLVLAYMYWCGQGLTELKQLMFEEMTDDERQCACCQTTLFLSAAVCPCNPSV